VDKEGYVQKEITFALDKALEKPEGTIFIIPAKLEECNAPTRLSRFHWVDLSRAEGHKRLMQSLNLRAASLGPEVSQAKVTDESSPRIPKTESVRVEKEEPIDKPVGQIANLSHKPAPQKGQERKPANKFDSRRGRIIGGLLIALLFGALGINYAINNWPVAVIPTPTSRPPTKTATFTPKLPTATITPAPPTFTPTPGIGSTLTSEIDGMMLFFVPAGGFVMGSDNNRETDEQPIYTISINFFWIDQTEVTNKMYALCVQAGICQPPSSTSSYSRKDYYGTFEFENHPVIYVDWNKAKTYCEWVGRRLPTEAEWEKAARGTDGSTYPWGSDSPTSDLLNYNSNVGDTTEVGKYPAGASVYGALDMAGNVWEWVSSLYQPYPYLPTDGREDLNASGVRVLRGGSLGSSDLYVRSSFRYEYIPSKLQFVGFRCALSE